MSLTKGLSDVHLEANTLEFRNEPIQNTKGLNLRSI